MSTEILEFLLSKATPTEIDLKSTAGKSPLHIVTRSGTTSALRVLVENGADVLAVDNEGKTSLDLAEDDMEKVKYLAEKMGEVLRKQGKYAEAMEVYKKLLDIQTTKTSPREEILETESNIALVHFEEKKFDEALKMLEVVRGKRNDFLGPFHIDTLRTKYDIGKVHLAQFKYDEALEYLKQVFEHWRERDQFGPDDEKTLSVEYDLADAYKNKGEYDEAFKLFSHVFESKKSSLDPKHPDVLSVWFEMAVVLVNKGESEKALGIFKEIYDARKAILGADDEGTISVDQHIKAIERLKKEAPKEGWWKIF